MAPSLVVSMKAKVEADLVVRITGFTADMVLLTNLIIDDMFFDVH